MCEGNSWMTCPATNSTQINVWRLTSGRFLRGCFTAAVSICLILSIFNVVVHWPNTRTTLSRTGRLTYVPNPRPKLNSTLGPKTGLTFNQQMTYGSIGDNKSAMREDRLPSVDPPKDFTLEKRLPHAIIIGVKKSGTTAIRTYLSMHPFVSTSRLEIHFFDHPDRRTVSQLQIYRRHLPESFPFQLTIEGTPAYFVTPEAPQLIHNMNSSIRLILMVRDPTSRALSDYVHSVNYKEDTSGLTFEEQVIDPRTEEVNASNVLISRSTYHLHLRRWLDVFPREQIFIMGNEELMTSPVQQLGKLEDFLGIYHYVGKKRFMVDRESGNYCLRGSGDNLNACPWCTDRRNPL